jgi:GNAT superfamily N-acetyltransferase
MGMRNRERGDGVPKEINVRPGGDRDVNLVKDLDLKCYQYPWEPDQWADAVGSGQAKWCLATLQDKPVGFAIWQLTSEGVVLDRLGVRPDSQNQGVGTELLRHVLKYTQTLNAKKITTVVPEINCCPGHPDDVSSWLVSRGFQTVLPIIPNHAYMYGQWSDGFCFVKPIEGGLQ